jgi:hypothetical protein
MLSIVDKEFFFIYFSDRDLILALGVYLCALIAFYKQWGCAGWFSVSVAHFLIVLAECVNGNSLLDWRPEFDTRHVHGLKANRTFFKVTYCKTCPTLYVLATQGK